MSHAENRNLLGAVFRRALSEWIKSIPVVGPPAEALTTGFVDEAQKQSEQQKLNDQLDRIEDDAAEIRSLRELIETLLHTADLLPATADQLRLLAQRRIAPSKLTRHHADNLIGRDGELAKLQATWDDGTARVFSIIAWGGAGKTALAAGFRARFAPETRDDCDGYLDWSFYQQGANSRDASSDAFFTHALEHLELDVPEGATAQIKARAVADRLMLGRWLLVLDGLEPLQHPPGSATPGALRDEGLRELLQCLGERDFPGLCLLTSREKLMRPGVSDERHWPALALEKLSDEAGAQLLHRAGAKRCGAAEIGADHPELLLASDELRGHPLSLQMIGGYLKLRHKGDIRKRADIEYERADKRFERRNAFGILQAYEQWMGESDSGRQMRAVLRLLGLFDRAAQDHCLDKLREAPMIDGLTDGLFVRSSRWLGLRSEWSPIDPDDWAEAVERLIELKLIERTPEDDAIDCHPLIREYFAARLKMQQQAWQAGHLRLFEHLCEHTEHQPDGEAGLRPLYQAVVHGCFAGKYEEARVDVYRDRILRGAECYSVHRLGLFATDLAALGSFFVNNPVGQNWSHPNPKLNNSARAWLLNEAAFDLRALGRLDEAQQPMAAGLEMLVNDENWKAAANSASNLSELTLTLGNLVTAISHGSESVTYADRSKCAFDRVDHRTVYADALHQSGEEAAARMLFAEAEAMQAERQPDYPRLYSLPSFRYTDLLLADAERKAWHIMLIGLASGGPPTPTLRADACRDCDVVVERVEHTLELVTSQGWLLDVALDNLTLSRSTLYRALLITRLHRNGNDELSPISAIALDEISRRTEAAVMGLHNAGQRQYQPLGLLTRAWLRQLQNDEAGSRADLAEARQIAEAGPMPLFLADIALTEARLFHDRDKLAEARTLIEKHGYHRRDEELEDAERLLNP